MEKQRLSESGSYPLKVDDDALALMQRATKIGRDVFRIPSLNKMQTDSVEAYYRGKHQLVVSPTGTGKSVCYTLPAMISGEKVLVISPLISLIQDQVEKLKSLGVACEALESTMSREEKDLALQSFVEGTCRILFVAPERLARQSFRDRLEKAKINLVAIDEAHCMSQWGLNFRPEYRKIGSYLKEMQDIKFIALTATAPKEVRSDIKKFLNLSSCQEIVSAPMRQNLDLEVIRGKTQKELLELIVSDVESEEGCGIIYAPTRKKVAEVSDALRKRSITCATYHGGMFSDERQENQHLFLTGQVDVIVATHSFGMGIHKDDVRFVFHYGMPGTLEAYVQEIGRAGRDGDEAVCRLYYGPRDYFIQDFMMKKSFPDVLNVQHVYQNTLMIISEHNALDARNLLLELGKRTKLQREDVQDCLAYLLRESLLATLSDQMTGEEMIVLGEDSRKADSEFWACYSEAYECRKRRLRAIYDFVKCESDRKEYISDYFQ